MKRTVTTILIAAGGLLTFAAEALARSSWG